jgi:hypothetical protein
MLAAIAAFAELIPGILAICRVADKDCNDRRDHENHGSTKLAQKERYLW